MFSLQSVFRSTPAHYQGAGRESKDPERMAGIYASIGGAAMKWIEVILYLACILGVVVLSFMIWVTYMLVQGILSGAIL